MKVSITINIDDRIVAIAKKLFTRKKLQVYVLFALLTVTIAYTQTSVPNPNEFNSEDVIKSDRLNQNFSLLRNTINGTIDDISALEISIANALAGFEERNNDLRAAITTRMNTSIPAGIIVMWSGPVYDDGTVKGVPKGWEICDGLRNGVPDSSIPDLRDKFVVAAGPTFPFGTSGSPEHNHIMSHDHYFYTTGGAGEHQHSWGDIDTSNEQWGLFDNNADQNPNLFLSSSAEGFMNFGGTFSGGPYIPLAIFDNSNENLTTSKDGVHEHDFDFSSDSNLTTGNAKNIPTYYSLLYIIRTD